MTTTEKRSKGKPRCEHGDSSPRSTAGSCKLCRNARQRDRYHAVKTAPPKNIAEEARKYQFYQGCGFLRSGSDAPIVCAYFVESKGGKKLWPEGPILSTDYAAARVAAREQADATGHPVTLVRREIQNRDVINEVRTEVRLSPPAPGAIIAGAHGRAVSL